MIAWEVILIQGGGVNKLIYLDYAATSWPKPTACLRAMEHFIAEIGSNPSYSLHKRARRGDDIIDSARTSVAKILGVGNASNVVFTLNATQALNQVLWSFVDRDYHAHTTVRNVGGILKKYQK